ncbi:MAG: hypothetical protein IPN29_12075 [Saprospiraceae bacterium]|nr:hypothetical protein [Saprospiraceae bacterium]
MKSIWIAAFTIWSYVLVGQGLQLGLGLGKSVYWGDLNAPEFSANLNNNGGLAIQVFGRYNYLGKAGLKFGALLGKIKGDDAFSSQQWQIERNLNFRSTLFELSLMGEYYIFGFDPFAGEQIFSPYITAGLAGFYFNPTTDYQGNTYELQPLGTEGQGSAAYGKKYSKYAVSVPFGAGAIIKAGQSFDVGFEVVARKAFTDYIDDISTNYINYNELLALNGELSAKLSDRTPEYFGNSEPLQRPTGLKRGGSSVKDWYFTAMVNLVFNITDSDSLGKRKSMYKSSCPRF